MEGLAFDPRFRSLPKPTEEGYFLILPVPPTVNHQKMVIRGRIVKTQEHRKYATFVYKSLLARRVSPLVGDVTMRIRWFRARKIGDVPDRWKTLCDAMKGLVYQDDRQIRRFEVERDDSDPKNARIEVKVSRYVPSQNL